MFLKNYFMRRRVRKTYGFPIVGACDTSILSDIGLGIGRVFKNIFYKIYVFNINLMLKKIMYKRYFKNPD